VVRLFIAVTLTFGFGAAGRASEAPYCLALRGNGDLAPAHWGALAQMVERLGLPSAMAGGSSASINLFLLESIAMNPLVDGTPKPVQKLRASLLLKSLQAYLEVIASRPEWRDLQTLASFLKAQGGGESEEFVAWLKRMVETQPEKLAALIMENFATIQESLQVAMKLGLVDPATFQPLFLALRDLQAAKSADEQQSTAARVQFYSGEIYRSVSLLGKFDAQSDHNLFFRSGLVNFKQLAVSFGQVANFYAGAGFSPRHRALLTRFFAECSDSASGKSWDSLRRSKPECDQRIKELVVMYNQEAAPGGSSREGDFVGAKIVTIPTTAILRGSAYLAAKAAFTRYHQALDSEFGKSFQVDPSEVRLGYWGADDVLSRIRRNLRTPFRDAEGTVWDFSQDEKSRLFEGLGPARWREVLSLSPAEPGLAPLQEFEARGEKLYSAGGWSDLHPGIVLKAAGCDQIVYVTRRGGESLFGQGVAKRLLGFTEVPWERLSTSPELVTANVIRNNNGVPSDLTSQWSRLYNLANPESSFNRTLSLVDSVVCTDWNRHSAMEQGGISAMIAESYEAPWAFARQNHSLIRAATQGGRRVVRPADNAVDPALGYRPYAGCIPF